MPTSTPAASGPTTTTVPWDPAGGGGVTAPALGELLGTYGLSCDDLAGATGASVARLRDARRGRTVLGAVVEGRLVELVRVLDEATRVTAGATMPGGEAAPEIACVQTRVSGRLAASLDPALAPRLLEVFADGRSDLVLAHLTGTMSGVEVLDAWRPRWRHELRVAIYEVFTDTDGHRSIRLRDPQDVHADRRRLGMP